MDVMSLLQGLQYNGNPFAALQGLQLGQGLPANSFGGDVPVNSPQPNAYGWQQLQALDQIDQQEPSYLSYPNQMQANQGGPQLPPPIRTNNNTAQTIQQQLGAAEPAKPDTVSNILSGRFQDLSGLPTGTQYGDYAQGVVQSALGKPQLGTQIGQERGSALAATLLHLQKLDMENRKLDYLTTSGSGMPAALQIADRIKKYRETGDTQALNDIIMSGKLMDKGVLVDSTGQSVPMNGYGKAVGTIAGTKKGMEQDAKNVSDITAAAPKAFNEKVGGGAGTTVAGNTNATADLKMLDYTINQAKDLVPKVSATGPILGRFGSAANDPDYANLQGALNGIVLQAKELYKLGSGQGFSDADRDFLQSVVGGKYSRAETINLALNRMAQISEKRQQFLGQQNESLGNQYGATQPIIGTNNQTSTIRTYNPQTGGLE